MTSFGVTPEGFVLKTVQDILGEIEDAQKSKLGNSLNLLPSSVLGQLNGIYADKLAEAWEVMQAVYAANYPSASGASLDGVASITGAIRLGPETSKVVAVVVGDNGTILLAGRVVSVDDTGDRFETSEDVTLVAVPIWTITTPYAVGNRVENGGNVYQCTDDGTSAGAGGPTGTGTAIVDGTVTWRFIGVGDAAADVQTNSEQFGPINAPAFTLNNIETPVVGWDSVTNFLDADPGRVEESDTAFRIRREQLLQLAGSATINAIRAEILKVKDVVQAFVYENVEPVTDENGVPPHAFEAVVRGGDELEIAQAIFDSKPIGIRAYGAITNDIEDSQGIAHEIGFSRPTGLDVLIQIGLTIDPDLYEGDDAVKQALVDFGDALLIGEDVIFLAAQCIALQVPGVLDVPDFLLTIDGLPAWAQSTAYEVGDRVEGIIPFHVYICTISGTSSAVGTGPSGEGSGIVDGTVVWDYVGASNLFVGSRELALFDTSRITVSIV